MSAPWPTITTMNDHRRWATRAAAAAIAVTLPLAAAAPAKAAGEWRSPATYGAAGAWTLMQHPQNVLSRSVLYHYDNLEGRVREWNTGGINNGDFIAVMVMRLPTIQQAQSAFNGQIEGTRSANVTEYQDGQGRTHAFTGTRGADWATFQSTHGWGYKIFIRDMLSGGTSWDGYIVDGIAQHGNYVVKTSRFSFTQPNSSTVFQPAALTNMARAYAANPPDGIPITTDYQPTPVATPPASAPTGAKPRPLPRILRAPSTKLSQVARNLRRPYSRLNLRSRHLRGMPAQLKRSLRLAGFNNRRSARVYLRRAGSCAFARAATRGGAWRPIACPKGVRWQRVTPRGLR